MFEFFCECVCLCVSVCLSVCVLVCVCILMCVSARVCVLYKTNAFGVVVNLKPHEIQWAFLSPQMLTRTMAIDVRKAKKRPAMITKH